MRFDDAVAQSLTDLQEQHLLRLPRVLSGRHGPEISIDGRRVLDFCSNDYLGLASDPRIASAARAALETHGFGAPSSRHISGTTDLHRGAEAAFARFVAAPRALLYSSGYAANTGALPALLDRDSLVFSDELNHASLIDGCRLSRARVHVYRHLDLDHLASLIHRHRAGAPRALLVTESVFSMEGDLAPLAALRALCDRHELGMYVDEAHALGVLGPQGRGACAAAGVVPDLLIGTLGKALGSVGAFVAGREATIALLENKSRSLVFSTAPPPSLAAAALRALELAAAADDRRQAVLGHAARIRKALQALGHPAPAASSPIVPLYLGSAAAAVRISTALFEQGLFVHGIRPPTVPPGTSRLRITPMATHGTEHLERLLQALRSTLLDPL